MCVGVHFEPCLFIVVLMHRILRSRLDIFFPIAKIRNILEKFNRIYDTFIFTFYLQFYGNYFRDEDPGLAKKPDPGLHTSNEGRSLNSAE